MNIDKLIKFNELLNGALDMHIVNLQLNLCPICGNQINEEDFKDSLSLKEYKISKMCQHCQDDFFI